MLVRVGMQNWWRSRAARLAFLKVLRISRIRLMRDEMNEVRTDCETITADMEDIRVDVANRLKAAKKYVDDGWHLCVRRGRVTWIHAWRCLSFVVWVSCSDTSDSRRKFVCGAEK